MRTFTLYLVTALAEIVGCHLPWLWLKQNGSPWVLVPAGASLAAFAWLLTLHDAASGRVYAAYGGVYVAVAVYGCGPWMTSARPIGMYKGSWWPWLAWASLPFSRDRPV